MLATSLNQLPRPAGHAVIILVRIAHHRPGTLYQQASKVVIAALGNAPQLLLPPLESLGNQAQIGREVTTALIAMAITGMRDGGG